MDIFFFAVKIRNQDKLLFILNIQFSPINLLTSTRYYIESPLLALMLFTDKPAKSSFLRMISFTYLYAHVGSKTRRNFKRTKNKHGEL